MYVRIIGKPLEVTIAACTGAILDFGLVEPSAGWSRDVRGPQDELTCSIDFGKVEVLHSRVLWVTNLLIPAEFKPSSAARTFGGPGESGGSPADPTLSLDDTTRDPGGWRAPTVPLGGMGRQHDHLQEIGGTWSIGRAVQATVSRARAREQQQARADVAVV